jgi:hypothetical protein
MPSQEKAKVGYLSPTTYYCPGNQQGPHRQQSASTHISSLLMLLMVLPLKEQFYKVQPLTKHFYFSNCIWRRSRMQKNIHKKTCAETLPGSIIFNRKKKKGWKELKQPSLKHILMHQQKI